MENVALRKPLETRRTKLDLENQIPLHRVSARGRRYVYVRGTNIALVKGFVGSKEDLESAIAKGVSEYLNRGHVHLNRLREEAATELHKRTLARARTKGRMYALTIEIVAQMLGEAQDRCRLTGIPFDYNAKAEGDQWLRRPFSPSLDRIDNRRGYELDNVRVVCTSVNIAIGEWGLETFDQICRARNERIDPCRPLERKTGMKSAEAPAPSDGP